MKPFNRIDSKNVSEAKQLPKPTHHLGGKFNQPRINSVLLDLDGEEVKTGTISD